MRRDITRVAIVTVLLFVGFFALLEVVTRNADGQGNVEGTGKYYRLTHAVVDGTLGNDGALTVSERITFEFHGNFSGAFRDIPLADNQTFEEIGVREGGTDYDSGASTELGGFGLPDTFGAVAARDENGKRVVRIVWHYSATDEVRTFQIHYRVRGLTQVHADAVDVFWQVWGDGWKGSLDKLDATLTIPAASASGAIPAASAAPSSARVARSSSRRAACPATSSSSCARCCPARRCPPARPAPRSTTTRRSTASSARSRPTSTRATPTTASCSGCSTTGR
jgi:hypothetical protein